MLDCWIGEDPTDFPATEDRLRFCRVVVYPKSKKQGKPEPVTISAFGEAADRIVDDLRIIKGDKVQFTGKLGSSLGRGRCGKTHRFNNLIATGCSVLEGSNDRQEKHYSDVSAPPGFHDDDQDPIFGRPIEEDPL